MLDFWDRHRVRTRSIAVVRNARVRGRYDGNAHVTAAVRTLLNYNIRLK